MKLLRCQKYVTGPTFKKVEKHCSIVPEHQEDPKNSNRDYNFHSPDMSYRKKSQQIGLFMNKIIYLFAPVGVDGNAFVLNLRANMPLKVYIASFITSKLDLCP